MQYRRSVSSNTDNQRASQLSSTQAPASAREAPAANHDPSCSRDRHARQTRHGLRLLLSWVSTANTSSRHFAPAGRRPVRQAREGGRRRKDARRKPSAPVGAGPQDQRCQRRCELSACGRRGWLASCECQDACSWLGTPLSSVCIINSRAQQPHARRRGWTR